VKYRILAGLFIGIIAAPALWAANVSVLVIESEQGGEKQRAQYAHLWENELLNALFESGHIVTNSPVITVDEKITDDFPAEAERDLENARDGGMDFFLIAIINYATPRVSLRLFDIKSTKKVLEQNYAITTFRNTNDEMDRIKTATRVLAAHVR